jgi:hypothetical protein
MATGRPDRSTGQIVPFPRQPGCFSCDSCRKDFKTGRLQLRDGIVVGATCQTCALVGSPGRD